MSRDRARRDLWPESDAERARHVRNQLMYAQRRQVGDEGLFLGRKTLRRNPGVIESDVGAFDQAIAAGALERPSRWTGSVSPGSSSRMRRSSSAGPRSNALGSPAGSPAL